MNDCTKNVVLRWAAAVIVPLGLITSARVCAAQRVTAPAKSSGSGAAGTQPNLSGVNPLLDRMCFPAKGPTTVRGTEWMTVDPTKRYTLSAWFKSVGTQPSNLYLGYACYDADKKLIAPEHVGGIAGATETTLYEACKKEDTVIKVTHAFKWKESPHACIAFEVDDKYSDLPNRKLSGFGINKLEEKEGYWEVRLNEPCGRAYPAGTKVREHSAGPAYLYCAAAAQAAPREWTQYSGSVMGRSEAGAGTAHWWPGTKYAKLIMLLNYDQNEDCTVLVGGIEITAESP